MTSDVLVLIDGECVLCNRVARFVMKRDPSKRIRFAVLGSPAAHLALDGLPPPPQGTFVLVQNGKVSFRSEAALQLAGLLTFPWPLLGVLRWIPRPVRDLGYGLVARVRYRLLGRVEECSLLNAEERERFLSGGMSAGRSETD